MICPSAECSSAGGKVPRKRLSTATKSSARSYGSMCPAPSMVTTSACGDQRRPELGVDGRDQPVAPAPHDQRGAVRR
jgi:hypothetical protein